MICKKDGFIVISERINYKQSNIPCWRFDCIKKKLEEHLDKNLLVFQTIVDNQNLLVSIINERK